MGKGKFANNAEEWAAMMVAVEAKQETQQAKMIVALTREIYLTIDRVLMEPCRRKECDIDPGDSATIVSDALAGAVITFVSAIAPPGNVKMVAFLMMQQFSGYLQRQAEKAEAVMMQSAGSSDARN